MLTAWAVPKRCFRVFIKKDGKNYRVERIADKMKDRKKNPESKNNYRGNNLESKEEIVKKCKSKKTLI